MSLKSSWSFLIDENTSRTLVAALHSEGYSAQHVYDADLQGHPDSEVYAYALAHEQVIITIDLGFANTIHYPPPHFGIIVLRIPNNTPIIGLIKEVQNALKALEGQNLADTLVIVEPGRIRVRR